MQPGDTLPGQFLVTNATTGAVVTGITAGTFSITGVGDGSALSITNTFAEIGSGWYKSDITLPSAATTEVKYRITSSDSSHVIHGGEIALELEEQDITSVYAVVVRPVISQSVTSAPTVDTNLVLDAHRYHEIRVTIVDQAGAGIDLSGYNNWTLTVQDADHTSNGNIPYSLASGITGDANGLLSIDLPETASFFSEIDSQITGSSATEITLYYDVKADKAATATKTQNIMRGQIKLRRFEGSA